MGETLPGRTQQEKVRQRPGSAETAGSPSSGCLTRRPVAGGRAGQGVDATDRAAAHSSPEARLPDPASAPAAAGKRAGGGGGAGGAGATQGEGATATRRGPGSRGHGQEGRASEQPTPTIPVLGAGPLKQSPRSFLKVPKLMFSPTFLLHWGAEGFPLGDPQSCVIQSLGAGRTCQKKEGRQWMDGSGSPNLRETSCAPLSQHLSREISGFHCP